MSHCTERICEDLTVDHSTNGIISGRVYLDTGQIECDTGFETPTKEPSFSVQCNHDKTWNSTFCYRELVSLDYFDKYRNCSWAEMLEHFALYSAVFLIFV